jgi:hypothetical protein
MKHLYGVIVLLVVWVLTLGGIIRNGTLVAYSNGTYIVVQWGTDDESQVANFFVERSSTSASAGFQDISAAISPTGNGSSYTFKDYSAFKTSESTYYYRIRIQAKDGTSSYSDTKLVTHSVSSVRRTWGSLKAMFR